MRSFRYTKGLHDLGNGLHAWLLPDGSWGWSNAGLIEDAGQTLLVDTLFDLQRTREMLDAMRDAVPAARDIGMLVNTHGNGDHTFGNQLLEGKRIIAAAGCAEDMKHRPPEQLAQWQRDWRTCSSNERKSRSRRGTGIGASRRKSARASVWRAPLARPCAASRPAGPASIKDSMSRKPS